MVEDKRWDQLTVEDWRKLALQWFEEMRQREPLKSTIGEIVALMNFSATPEQQWQFILAALTEAESDLELKQIAAGPIEHLLGWHGDEFISRIENEVKSNPKLERALTGVCKYLMSKEIWQRIQALRANVGNPLLPYK